eukprot:jgi/Bigna1/44789/e_gw1.103.33.1
MRDEPDVWLRCPTGHSSRYHKRCWLIWTAGRWSWKSKSAKECVTTHLPNQLALKMDGAEVIDLYRTIGASVKLPMSRRTWGRVKPPLVQILVVVANIQMRTLKTEVEKGSM